MKRKRDLEEQDESQEPNGSLTRKEDKSASVGDDEAEQEQQNHHQEPATKRRRGRPAGSKNRPRTAEVRVTSNSSAPITPSKPRQPDIPQYTTPSKSVRFAEEPGGAVPVRNADRSARRKSAQKLIERTTSGVLSDEDVLEEGEDELLQDIWGDDNEEEDDDNDQLGAEEGRPEENEHETNPSTPSKRKRGRSKGSRKKSSPPAPPSNMPVHEQYFFHNRPGGNKTSNNTLSSISLLSHEEYFDIIRDYIDPHEQERAILHELHARAFRQWRFETHEGFSVCLYGWGSKRSLIMEYAEWLYDFYDPVENTSNSDDINGNEQSGPQEQPKQKIVIVNGYLPTITLKEIINMIAVAFFGINHTYKISGQPTQMTETLLSLLNTHPSANPITVIIHSIDSPHLRTSTTQTLLSRLASNNHIHLICSTDHPSFPLLWDTNLRETFNFVFHDATTFDPYEVEVDVVDAVNDLLGRSGRRVTGKEGVGYVLRSLPENARNLFRVLVGEQLAGMEGGIESGGGRGVGGGSGGGRVGSGGGDDDDEDDEEERGRRTSGGIEYRVLYQKAVEEFICSNEIAFRTLLKEFHDHQMITSKKDVLGTELLWVPFRKEELESILEELLG
ncbi:MAG: hypothetical protein M1823_005543 [Watsoniomyces obsoletus]|nr:MAG: hypothetical protein M1823_005543 [Watsoniomyces obsoletus]